LLSKNELYKPNVSVCLCVIDPLG